MHSTADFSIVSVPSMSPLRSHYVPTMFQVGPRRVFDPSKAFNELCMNDLIPNIVAPSQMIMVAMIIQLSQENLNDWSCPFQFVQRTIEALHFRMLLLEHDNKSASRTMPIPSRWGSLAHSFFLKRE